MWNLNHKNLLVSPEIEYEFKESEFIIYIMHAYHPILIEVKISAWFFRISTVELWSVRKLITYGALKCYYTQKTLG